MLPAVAGVASREGAPLCRPTPARTKCWLLLCDRTVTDTNEYCSQSTQHYIQEESRLHVSAKYDQSSSGLSQIYYLKGSTEAEPDARNSPHGFLNPYHTNVENRVSS